MSALREAADAAMRAKRAEQAAERAAKSASVAAAAVKRAADSPLGKWYPKVEWEFVANLADGTTLVRERAGLDTILGVKMTRDAALFHQGPDEWQVAVYQRQPLSSFVGGTDHYQRLEVLETPDALGEFIERTTPRSEPTREDAPA